MGAAGTEAALAGGDPCPRPESQVQASPIFPEGSARIQAASTASIHALGLRPDQAALSVPRF